MISPDALSVLGMLIAVGAAVLAANGLAVFGAAAWVASRVVDGLDGAVARHRNLSTDRGGYVDLLADHVAYAAIPIGVAIGANTQMVWVAVAVLLATFYVNAASWAVLAAILEKRNQGSAARGEQTTVTMPVGLVEGAETICFFTVFLLFRSIAHISFVVMAALVALTVLQRLVWAHRHLAPGGES